MFTQEFITPYAPDTTEEKAFNYILYESGLFDYLDVILYESELVDYLDVSASEEHTKKFKVTLTVEEVED